MSRWETFVERVDEKVSKKEIDEALKNSNILIGAEFEFKVEEGLSGGNDYDDLYHNADSEIQDYNRSVDLYNRNLAMYEKDTRELMDKMEYLGDERDKYTYLIDDSKSDIEDLQEKIKGLVADRKSVEADIKGTKSKEDEALLKKRLVDIKDDILHNSKKLAELRKEVTKWEKQVDKYDNDIDDLKNDIRYREEEGMYEEFDTPYLSPEAYSDYFDYMEQIGYSKRDLYVEPGEYADRPPEYESGEVDFEEAVESSGILNTAPFSDYNIGTYGSFSPKPGSRTWAVESDSSLGEDGVEVKSPPMPVPVFVKSYLGEMFKWIDTIGYTDSQCGFHCHMSLKNSIGEIDYIKLILFTDEGWIYKLFSERAGSYYARSVKEKMKTGNILSKSEVSQLFNRQALLLKSKMASQHYDAVSLIDIADNHVEFRYMGSKDYHKKLSDVIATIGVYAHNLALACDPDYKRKEYILKIARVMNKMELFAVTKKLDFLGFITSSSVMTADDKKIIDMEKKKLLAYMAKLSSYKLDRETVMGLSNNSEFYRGVMSDVASGFASKLSKDMREWMAGSFANVKI